MLILITCCAVATTTTQATTYKPNPYITTAYLEGIKDATIYHLGFWAAALLCNFQGPFAILGHAFGALTRHCAAQEHTHQEAYHRGGRDAMTLLAIFELLRSIATPQQQREYRYLFMPVPVWQVR
jgi:hypothetical protein